MKQVIPFLSAIMIATIYVHAGSQEEVKPSKPSLQSEQPKKKRAKGGGAGGFVPYIVNLDMSQIEKMTSLEADLKSRSFDLNNNQVFLYGGMGYGGKRNGVRIGGGGWGGYRSLYSDSYPGIVTDSAYLAAGGDSTMDSLAKLDVIVVFGGFLVEKGFSFGSLNVFAGTLMGAGALIVHKEFLEANQTSAFQDISYKPGPHPDPDSLASSIAVAPMSVFDIHAGLAYSLASWIQVGVDGGMLAFHSTRSFGYGYSSFWTFNPGVRFRILFGNLG